MQCDDVACQCHDGKLPLGALVEVAEKMNTVFSSTNRGLKGLMWAFFSTVMTELDLYRIHESWEMPLTSFDRGAKRIAPLTALVRNTKNYRAVRFYERNIIRLLKATRESDRQEKESIRRSILHDGYVSPLL